MEGKKMTYAEWEEGYYAEEGYGFPVWCGKWDDEKDLERKCWDFFTEYNSQILMTA
jgi:hypothetical protein